jgi:N-acetylmuramic acid 6-phosphate (MurNAc-6-P) etherase
VGPDVAAQALQTSEGEVKPAILIAAGVGNLAAAVNLLGATKGNVRTALAKLGAQTPVDNQDRRPVVANLQREETK